MKYRIKSESLHPEFDVPEELKNGVEANGYMIVAFDENDNPLIHALSGVSIMDLAKWLDAYDEASASAIVEAFMIAEGLKNARNHSDECERKKFSRAAFRRMIEDE
jgi:hypothetical protein